MVRRSFWGFQVEIDESATREWYAQAGIWDCECGYCSNFMSIVEKRNLPVPVMEMLNSLGIPPEKATYVGSLTSDNDGCYYLFCYRIAGRMLDEETHKTVEEIWGEVYCGHDSYNYGAPNFPHPHFDLEFLIVLPWVSAKPVNE